MPSSNYHYERAHGQSCNGPPEIWDFKAIVISLSLCLASPPAPFSLCSEFVPCFSTSGYTIFCVCIFPSPYLRPLPSSIASSLSTLPPSSRSFRSQVEKAAVRHSIFPVLVLLKYTASVFCVHIERA